MSVANLCSGLAIAAFVIVFAVYAVSVSLADLLDMRKLQFGCSSTRESFELYGGERQKLQWATAVLRERSRPRELSLPL